MIIYIHGSDTFRSREYLQQTIERFRRERDPQGYNVIRLDGARDGEEKIMDALVSTPFLARKRMVVVENLLARKSADLLGTIADYIKNNRLSAENVYVFWQGEDIGKSKTIKELEVLLKKEKWAMEFKPISKDKLSAWITQETEKRGGSMVAEATNYLAEHAGDNTWRLNSLIDQLVAYALSPSCQEGAQGGVAGEIETPATPPAPPLGKGRTRVIQLSDVQLFLEEKIEDNIFGMAEAIAMGNRRLAFKLLNDQRRKGEDDGYIFAMILRQFRILAEMRDLYNREDNIVSDRLAKELGLHPFAAKKSFPLMKRYALPKLKEIYDELLQIDIKTKTGAAPQSLLLDLFVGKNT